MNDDEATRAGQLGQQLPPSPADAAGTTTGKTAWVGRAKPPPAPTPPPADPYWPPVEGPHTPYDPGYAGPAYGSPGYRGPSYPAPVAAARRRSGRTALLVIAGVLAACCAGGATLALLGGALAKDVTQDAAGPGAGQDQGGSGEDGSGEDGKDGSGQDAGKPGLNTPVRDGKFEFVVTSVSCGNESVGTSIIKAEAKGQFCIVTMSIANIGTEAQTFTDVFQKALGPDGTVYGADAGAGLIANEGGAVFWKVINPGNSATGKIVYDIPAGASIATLELHDSLLSGGVMISVTGT